MISNFTICISWTNLSKKSPNLNALGYTRRRVSTTPMFTKTSKSRILTHFLLMKASSQSSSVRVSVWKLDKRKMRSCGGSRKTWVKSNWWSRLSKGRLRRLLISMTKTCTCCKSSCLICRPSLRELGLKSRKSTVWSAVMWLLFVTTLLSRIIRKEPLKNRQRGMCWKIWLWPNLRKVQSSWFCCKRRDGKKLLKGVHF